MADELSYLTKEYKELLQKENEGIVASTVKEFVNLFCDKTIEKCKEKFSTISTFGYQNIDKNEIFVLQLNIAVAKQLKVFVEQTALDGVHASDKLRELGRR